MTSFAPDDLAELDPASVPAGERATLATLDDVLPILRSPDSGSCLTHDGHELAAGSERFALADGSPILLPARVSALADRVELGAPLDPLQQYVVIGRLKQQGGEQNTPAADVWYRRHAYRCRALLAAARGLVVDVGCDDPAISAALFPASARYVGLDPRPGAGPFRVVGMAEFLPFSDGSVDGVALLTSLDHVLDHHRGLAEAWRALKPGGQLFLASLVWTRDADLHHDSVHFHHFREAELLSALSAFRVDWFRRFSWKSDQHRTVVYLAAAKTERRA